MKKRCANCKFLETEPELEPCRSCGRYYLSLANGTTDNWQPRPKRKELEAQLSTANAELESMHRELADKKAIIEEQRRELDELQRKYASRWEVIEGKNRYIGALQHFIESLENERWKLKRKAAGLEEDGEK